MKNVLTNSSGGNVLDIDNSSLKAGPEVLDLGSTFMTYTNGTNVTLTMDGEIIKTDSDSLTIDNSDDGTGPSLYL